MTITRRLMKPGQFSVSLKPGTPKSVMKAIDKFDHVVITRNRLLPIDAYSDANVLAQSLYTGVIEELSRTGNSLAGFDLSYWLGTPDGRGDLLDTAVSRTSGTLQDWIGDLRPASLSAGTVTNTGTNLTNTYQWMTRREAIDAVCRSVGAEWRVNPNGTLDAAAPATLFTATPEIVITRHPQGNDGAFRGIEVGAIGTSESVATYVTKAIVVGDGLVSAEASGSTSYKDLLNGNVVFESFVSAPSDAAPSAVATAILAERNSVRRELTLSSRSYNVTRFVEPGDWVYAWDEQGDLVDQANQITYNGRLISPIALRVYSVTFPLEEGMGVYVRRSGATPVYTDVTDWVEWESGDVRWEVGATALPSVQLAKGTAYLGANRDMVERAAAPAGKIGFETVTTSQVGISTVTDLTGLSRTFTAVAGRLYRYSALVRLEQSTAAGLPQLVFADGSNNQLAAWQGSLQAGERMSAAISCLGAPAAGSFTVKLRLSTTAGTVGSIASATASAYILVEDIGAD